MVTAKGLVFSWGSNEDGRLGIGMANLTPSSSSGLMASAELPSKSSLMNSSNSTTSSPALPPSAKSSSKGDSSGNPSPAKENSNSSNPQLDSSSVTPNKKSHPPTDATPNGNQTPKLDQSGSSTFSPRKSNGTPNPESIRASGDSEPSSSSSFPKMDFTSPRCIAYFKDRGMTIVRVAAGYYHSAALDDAGRVYTWGIMVSLSRLIPFVRLIFI